ncbi:hypothetical protein [Leptospira alexanderi]|uniref:hypothetical protein n=1 Tax=Leptospira alexanderi TaxID=100053 RepID=UPI00099110AE|nr:hypothetical protein [Leptospira alexanderi]
MPQYVDCYWLVRDRRSEITKAFLNKFLPEREESFGNYPVPMRSESPIKTFMNVNELIEYLQDSDEEYLIYWKNTNPRCIFKHGIAIYTDDKRLILGVSIEGNAPDEKDIIERYYTISNFLNAEISCITVEEVAPSNSVAFREFCKNRYVPEPRKN